MGDYDARADADRVVAWLDRDRDADGYGDTKFSMDTPNGRDETGQDMLDLLSELASRGIDLSEIGFHGCDCRQMNLYDARVDDD